MQLSGKTIYITGGTGGMGIPLVEMLRAKGAVVNLHDLAVDGDLVAGVDGVAEALRKETPDILINMAGIVPFGRAESQNMRLVTNLNLLVPMLLTQAVLPAMKARGGGVILNVASMVGVIPLPHMTGYAASKAGLKAFGDALRRELHGTGVRVTTILPRAVRTPANAGAMAAVNAKTGVAQDDPHTVAARIVDALERKENEVRMGRPERFFALLNALCPHVVDKGLRKAARVGEEVLKGLA